MSMSWKGAAGGLISTCGLQRPAKRQRPVPVTPGCRPCAAHASTALPARTCAAIHLKVPCEHGVEAPQQLNQRTNEQPAAKGQRLAAPSLLGPLRLRRLHALVRAVGVHNLHHELVCSQVQRHQVSAFAVWCGGRWRAPHVYVGGAKPTASAKPRLQGRSAPPAGICLQGRAGCWRSLSSQVITPCGGVLAVPGGCAGCGLWPLPTRWGPRALPGWRKALPVWPLQSRAASARPTDHLLCHDWASARTSARCCCRRRGPGRPSAHRRTRRWAISA